MFDAKGSFLWHTKKNSCLTPSKRRDKAPAEHEVPVGAVVVCEGKIIARAHNRRENKQSATAHAELLAIEKACRKLKSWRLVGCELYVTLEPCPMCAGAIINSRIDAVYFGASDPKAGCCGSLYNLTGDVRFNHRPIVEGGFLKERCARLLTDYFKDKRKNRQENENKIPT